MSAGNKNKLEPWQKWPYELIRHAEVHYRRDSDYDKRLAFISFYNFIEASISAHLSQPDHRGGKQHGKKKTKHFVQKLDFFMEEIKHRNLNLPEHIKANKNRYREQRNRLLHESGYEIPEKDILSILDSIRDLSILVFEILFDTPDIEQKIARSISSEFMPSVPIDPNILEALAVAALLGAWKENSDADREVVKGLLVNELMDFDQWIENLQKDSQRQGSPLKKLQNGHWRIPDRKSLWKAIGHIISDDHLDQLKACAVEVLTERDPKFELPETEHFAAAIYGKTLKHSPALRRGMAESLALLGNCSDSDTFIRCSPDKLEFTPTAAVRKILENADGLLWASLNGVLPTLAEAAPGEFLKIAEATLAKTPCPYDEIFAQEGDGWTGGSYITGMLWALEGLAWKEEYLGHVTVILAGLAARDPGGNLANRPINSLHTILLPWYPQTLASIDRRIAAIKAIQLDFPEVAWQVLLSLLPSLHQRSLGTHKPVWLSIIPEDWQPKVTDKEYWQQVDTYSQLAVDMVVEDRKRLGELADNLGNLPQPYVDSVLEHLSSETITNLSEKDRFPIWRNLTRLAAKHRRYPDAKWALDESTVARIEDVARKLTPTTPERLYRRLFTDNRHDLYEGDGDWEDEDRKLENKRRQAIRKILEHSGIKGVIAFVDTIEPSYPSYQHVGFLLAAVADGGIDSVLLPQYLDAEDIRHKIFIGDFVLGRYKDKGWAWVDTLATDGWSLDQRCRFLGYLPSESKTWQRAKEWLVDDENRYWKQVEIKRMVPSYDDYGTAIDKLLEVNRPLAAIRLLCGQLYGRRPLDTNRVVKALLAAVSTDEPPDDMTSRERLSNIVEFIRKLQDAPGVDKDDLFKVEWAYLRLLTSLGVGAWPKYLSERLATRPEFFSEVIQLSYRSKNENKPDGETDDRTKDMVTNAWHLLRTWKTPPGLNGKDFSMKNFKSWFDKVKEQCTESGHLEVAMREVGGVLFYCPPDPQGLWINQSVAEVLNAEDADRMRTGFCNEIFYPGGVHRCDPTAERKLAKRWQQKANEVGKKGYTRFAAELRRVAVSYDREAERLSQEED